MANEEEVRETVSVEAHERVKTENAKLQTQIGELQTTVIDFAKVESARSWFIDQGVTDADAKAQFVLPHLRNVEVDGIGETLSQEQFKFLSTSVPPPDTTSNDLPDVPQEEAIEPPAGGFTGPNPGGTEAPPDGNAKITQSSPEYRAVVQANDWTTMQKWIDDDRLADPQKPY